MPASRRALQRAKTGHHKDSEAPEITDESFDPSVQTHNPKTNRCDTPPTSSEHPAEWSPRFPTRTAKRYQPANPIQSTWSRRPFAASIHFSPIRHARCRAAPERQYVLCSDSIWRLELKSGRPGYFLGCLVVGSMTLF